MSSCNTCGDLGVCPSCETVPEQVSELEEQASELQAERLLMRDIVRGAMSFVRGTQTEDDDLSMNAYALMKERLERLAKLGAEGKLQPFPELALIVDGGPPGTDALREMLRESR